MTGSPGWGTGNAGRAAPRVSYAGSEVPRGEVLQYLLLELLEPPRLIGLQPAVLATPLGVRLIRDADLPARLFHRQTLRQMNLRLTQFVDEMQSADC